MTKKIAISLSGGMDSATLLAYYHNKKYKIIPVFFDYGSKHNQYEAESAVKLANYYGYVLRFIPLGFIGETFKSNLLKTGGEIPEGHYEDKSMTLTVVPGRNMIFISILMGLAWSLEATKIAIGVHAGDHAIYPDCRPQFISDMKEAVKFGSDHKVYLEAPFLFINKTEILRMGIELAVPYHLTRTCYKSQPLSCGKCGSCVERLESFAKFGLKDPILYE
jgi:7-cyano-7-deazaguanine synthase